MKKIIFLAITFTLLTVTAAAFAADFKPLSIPGYSIRMPEGAVLPDRSILKLAETKRNPMDLRITMFLYRTEKIYIDEGGEFVYPYMEITIEADDYSIHLLTLSFINEKLEIELFENKAAFGDSHQDELMRIERLKQRKIREFNR